LTTKGRRGGVLLTSDPDDLTALLSGVAGVQVIRV